MDDFYIVSVSESPGNNVLVTSLLHWIESVFNEDIQMCAVKDDLLFRKIHVGDYTRSGNSHTFTALHRVEAKRLDDMFELHDGTIHIVRFPFDLPDAWMSSGFKFVSKF